MANEANGLPAGMKEMGAGGAGVGAIEPGVRGPAPGLPAEEPAEEPPPPP